MYECCKDGFELLQSFLKFGTVIGIVALLYAVVAICCRLRLRTPNPCPAQNLTSEGRCGWMYDPEPPTKNFVIDDSRFSFLKEIKKCQMATKQAQDSLYFAHERKTQCDCEYILQYCTKHKCCGDCCSNSGWCKTNYGVQWDDPNTPFMDSSMRVNLNGEMLGKVPNRFGFKCREARGVVLSKNGLTELPEDMSMIRYLNLLNISDNYLFRIPRVFGNFNFLSCLNLSSNALNEFPRTILELVSLVSLYMNDNNIREIPEEIVVLQRLQFLFLAENRITRLPSSLFRIPALQYLCLYDNPLKYIPASICHAKNLATLFVTKCSLTYIPPSISQCYQLRTLRIAQNFLTHIPSELSQIITLSRIDISGNNMECLPSSLLKLKNNLILGGRCQTFVKYQVDGDNIKDCWEIVKVVPPPTPRKSPQSLTDMAMCAVKEYGLNTSGLSHDLQGRLTHLHSCNKCNRIGMRAYVMLKRLVKLNGQIYPFSYIYCREHFWETNDLAVLKQELSLFLTPFKRFV